MKHPNQQMALKKSKTKSEKSTEEIEYYCRIKILNCLSDVLYETFSKYQTAKKIHIKEIMKVLCVSLYLIFIILK
jgi:hypothetical protein